MENSFQTSFIPKKPIIESGAVSRNRSSSVSLFSVLSVIILIITVGAAGGLFFYNKYLSNQIDLLSASIVKAQGNFDQDTITELGLYNKRYSAASSVLNGHIILSPIFKLIASVTIPTVQYTRFNENTGDNTVDVRMSGIARDYRSVALQADVFNSEKARFFKNVVFSNINRDKSGSVFFDIAFSIDKSILSYENDVSNKENSKITASVSNAISGSELNPASTQTPALLPSGNTENSNTITQTLKSQNLDGSSSVVNNPNQAQ